MNKLKAALLSAAFFFALSTAAVMQGCVADACLDLKCQNGGSCAENFCRCPTGFEGAECEFRTVDRLLGTYVGFTTCDSFARLSDTTVVFLRNAPLEVGVVRFSDSTGAGRDTLYGMVEERGYRITIPDVVDGSRRRYASALITDKNFTFYEENVPNVSTPNAKQVCSFVGNEIVVP